MQNQIQKAIEVLKTGGIILFPMETVYGIAADASSNSAIEKIYKLKARDTAKPLQIMVLNLERAEELAVFGTRAKALAKKYWPGALTLVLKKKPNGLAAKFNQVDDTIGIRIPNHKIALEILAGFGKPLVVTSANISGGDSNIDFDSAKLALEGIDFAVEGGVAEIGISSTVVNMVDEAKPVILRVGNISEREILAD